MININGLKLNSIDYIFIVDRDFSVVYNTRYDKRLNANTYEFEKDEYINRNFFQIYPSIKKESSSIVRCMTTGEIVINKNQNFKDLKGKIYCTHNITVPLVIEGKIMGVVEFVKDVTTINNIDNYENTNINDLDLNIDNICHDNITFDKFITTNNTMLEVIDHAKILAKTNNPTLVYGETGTGKEILVQAMITHSGIRQNKIIIQNCAAVPDNLIESMLFGTVKGAYTGSENRKGLFEEADNGIIFLDEINSLPYYVQGKLLRVLQDGTFRPIGSNIEKIVKTKVIAAMNIDPMLAIENNVFRKDLFYRFTSSMIKIPPLRERQDDIKLFINYYLKECNTIYNKNVVGITEELENFFLNYKWEGNVREIKHVIEAMISITKSNKLYIKDLPAYMYDKINNKNSYRLIDNKSYEPGSRLVNKNYNLRIALKNKERELILEVIRETKGNKTAAAEILGIPRQTLKYKMDRLELD